MIGPHGPTHGVGVCWTLTFWMSQCSCQSKRGSLLLASGSNPVDLHKLFWLNVCARRSGESWFWYSSSFLCPLGKISKLNHQAWAQPQSMLASYWVFHLSSQMAMLVGSQLSWWVWGQSWCPCFYWHESKLVDLLRWSCIMRAFWKLISCCWSAVLKLLLFFYLLWYKQWTSESPCKWCWV